MTGSGVGGGTDMIVIGQIVASLGQAFFVNPPPLVASTWYAIFYNDVYNYTFKTFFYLAYIHIVEKKYYILCDNNAEFHFSSTNMLAKWCIFNPKYIHKLYLLFNK